MKQDDVVYEDIDETGEVYDKFKMDRKAREPKTPMQTKALELFRMARFPSNSHHKRFRRFEELTIAGDDSAILYRGYFADLFEWIKKKNTTVTAINLDVLLRMLEDEDRYRNYAASGKAQKFLADNLAAVRSGLGVAMVGKPLAEEE